jgi:hypothetical protein
MTATAVYGVHLGDEFKDPEGNHLRVEEFVGKPSGWIARLHHVDDESLTVEVDVKDVKEWEKVV